MRARRSASGSSCGPRVRSADTDSGTSHACRSWPAMSAPDMSRRMNRQPYSVSIDIDSARSSTTSITTPSSAGYSARRYSGAYTGTPSTSPTCSLSGPGQKSSYRNGAVDSQHPVPIVNTSSPRRSRFALSTMRAAASVPVTFIRSDVGAQSTEVQVAVAVGGGVLPHVLDLAVLVVAEVAELATDTRLLVATKGLRRRDHVVVVHPHGAGTHCRRDAVRAVEVLRPDAAAEPVDRVVRDLDRLVVGVEGDHAQHRPEDLLLRDLHRVVGLEDRREVVRALIEPRGQVARLGATAEQLGALVEAELHVPLGRVDLARRDERAEVGRHIHIVADDDLAGALDEQPDELVPDLARHQRACARLAHLSVVEERAPQHTCRREIEIGIVEHD